MQTLEKPDVADESVGTPPRRIAHAVCSGCFPRGTIAKVALCGTPVMIHNRSETGNPRRQKCIVCLDLFNKPCERCGRE